MDWVNIYIVSKTKELKKSNTKKVSQLTFQFYPLGEFQIGKE